MKSIWTRLKKVSWLVLSLVLLCYSIATFSVVETKTVLTTNPEKASPPHINSIISFEDAKTAIQKHYHGTILRIWRKDFNGKDAYHVRILSPNGKVHTHIVDAHTADIVQ